MLETSMNQM